MGIQIGGKSCDNRSEARSQTRENSRGEPAPSDGHVNDVHSSEERG